MTGKSPSSRDLSGLVTNVMEDGEGKLWSTWPRARRIQYSEADPFFMIHGTYYGLRGLTWAFI